MAVVVEISHYGYVVPFVSQPAHDFADRPGRGIAVDGDPHQLGAGRCKLPDLTERGPHVDGIRIGHGLDHDGRIATDRDVSHFDRDRLSDPGHGRNSTIRPSSPTSRKALGTARTPASGGPEKL